MLIKKWEKLPAEFQIDEIKPYWQKLRKKNFSLFWKRLFDVVISFLALILLFPLFIILSLCIKCESKGPVFYRQIRCTQYGKEFKIHKFRSMKIDSDKGSLVTIKNDNRITKIGKFIRKFKIDELGQLIDVFTGNMTFVGTRPEVVKYVSEYKNEYFATLLLPAGITSMTSLLYKDENELLENAEDADSIYLNVILPEKMRINLSQIKKESLFYDVKVLFMTFLALCGKDYSNLQYE